MHFRRSPSTYTFPNYAYAQTLVCVLFKPELNYVSKFIKTFQSFSNNLYEVVQRLLDLTDSAEKAQKSEASLIGVRAHCGFTTGLLVVHRNEK